MIWAIAGIALALALWGWYQIIFKGSRDRNEDDPNGKTGGAWYRYW